MQDQQKQFDQLCREITPVDQSLFPKAQAHLDNLTKPQGSLGRLETIAARLFCLQKGQHPIKVDPVRMYTVAGDHGVAAEGVSPFPQAVTRQMVQNFLNGGAAINALCKAANIDLRVVDAGCVGGPFAPHAQLIDVRLGEGTDNFANGPAMSRELCLKALLCGAELAAQAAAEKVRTIGVGEMGIANTTPATALFCAYLHLEPEVIAGPGAGSSPEKVRHKAQIVRKAFAANKAAWNGGDNVDLLAALGGFEIAVMAGLMLGAARHGLTVMVDGFISTAAFVSARALCPAVEGYCFLSHASAEPGYAGVVKSLGGMFPLLHLDLRLGEGTGAALAVPLLRGAESMFNNMATFDQAGVTGTPCNH